MKYRIALLLKKHFIDYLAELIGSVYEDCALTYLEYDTLPELQALFVEKQSHYDGFVASASVPLAAIQSAMTPSASVPTIAFPVDAENTYRILVQLLLRQERPHNLHIGLDHLESGQTLEEILAGDDLSERIAAFDRQMRHLDTRRLQEAEAAFIRKYREQHDRGELDLVVTYFYSVLETLRPLGIECHYIYPGRHSIRHAFESLKSAIELQRLQHNLPAVVHVNPLLPNAVHREDIDLWISRLKQAVLLVHRNFGIDPILKNNYLDLEIYLNSSQLNRLTQAFNYCYLSKALREHADFQGAIGYGIGENLNQARIRAFDASRFGLAQTTSDRQNILIDNTETPRFLSSTPGAQAAMLPRYLSQKYLNHLSTRSGLTTTTIAKIVGALQTLNTNNVTAGELAKHLEITPRAANKFLTALAKAGIAQNAGMRNSGGQGRPAQAHLLHIEYR